MVVPSRDANWIHDVSVYSFGWTNFELLNVIGLSMKNKKYEQINIKFHRGLWKTRWYVSKGGPT